MLVTFASYYLDLMDILPEALGCLLDALDLLEELLRMALPAAWSALLGAAWAAKLAYDALARPAARMAHHAAPRLGRKAANGAAALAKGARRLGREALGLARNAAYGLAELWRFRQELIDEERGEE